MDYSQNNTFRKEFHKDKPIFSSSIFPNPNTTEPSILMGNMDEEGLTFGVLLGVWKPVYPSKICDYPLAFIDARLI